MASSMHNHRGKVAVDVPAARVLMLLENAVFGDDVRVESEAKSLRDAGYSVSVISPAEPGGPLRESLDGIEVYRFKAPAEATNALGYLWEYGYSLTACMALSLWIFVRRGFDVIHAHNPPDLFVLIALFFRPFGTKFVFDQHDLSPEMYSLRFSGGENRFLLRILEFFERLSCRFADRTIATNESYREIQIDRCGVSPSKITVVRNGPDLERFRPAEPRPRSDGKTTILYVGVFGTQDGIDYLIRALSHLRHDEGLEDFHCLIVGDGETKQELVRLTEELELGEHVEFSGYLRGPALIEALTSADIGVVPDPSNAYNDRSTMIKVMEYMAVAKPVVAFDLPENRFTAGDAALYAKANSERDFATEIARLMKDPALRSLLGARGLRRVEEELAWCHQAPHLIDAYRSLDLPASRSVREAV